MISLFRFSLCFNEIPGEKRFLLHLAFWLSDIDDRKTPLFQPI